MESALEGHDSQAGFMLLRGSLGALLEGPSEYVAAKLADDPIPDIANFICAALPPVLGSRVKLRKAAVADACPRSGCRCRNDVIPLLVDVCEIDGKEIFLAR